MGENLAKLESRCKMFHVEHLDSVKNALKVTVHVVSRGTVRRSDLWKVRVFHVEHYKREGIVKGDGIVARNVFGAQ